MPVQGSQGRPRPQAPRADELPAGVPAPARRAPARDTSGKFVKSDGTTALAREGGRARAEARQLAQLLGLQTLDEDHAYAPYARLAREFRDHHMAELAATVGGGRVGPGPASVVSTAALQMAASRYLGDLGAAKCDAKLLLDASRLGDASRANLLSAHELCAREAKARDSDSEHPWERERRLGLVGGDQ